MLSPVFPLFGHYHSRREYFFVSPDIFFQYVRTAVRIILHQQQVPGTTVRTAIRCSRYSSRYLRGGFPSFPDFWRHFPLQIFIRVPVFGFPFVWKAFIFGNGKLSRPANIGMFVGSHVIRLSCVTVASKKFR